jgi:phosphoserine phosphatase
MITPRHRPWLLTLTLTALLSACAGTAPAPPAATEPASESLASWAEGPGRAAIVEFVERVTDPASADFVPVAERIAVFDNDGTLWAEKPAYFQLFFAVDQMQQYAEADPEVAAREPFRTLLDEGMRGLDGMDVHDLLGPLVEAAGGMSESDFHAEAAAWLATARHPEREVAYTNLVYQPMLELLDYLRANDFQTWICSGGGIDFVRAFSEEAYGIPPEQVIGTTLALSFDEATGVMRMPEIDHINDGPGKPVGIARHIGRRPILAFGNSDGDLQMLQYATSGPGPALALLLHHDDADREWAYDRDSSVGRLNAGFDMAAERGWTLVSMREAWSAVFPVR